MFETFMILSGIVIFIITVTFAIKEKLFKTNNHVHDWKLISKTYFPGLAPRALTANNTDMFKMWVEAMQDKTSYLFQCSDVTCKELRKEILDGKEVLNENGT